MNRRSLALAAAVVLAFGVFAIVTMMTRYSQLLIPAVVMRGTDPGEAVAPSFADRVARSVHDRFGGRAEPGRREIALTFDDGPYAVSTPLLLDVLADLHVHATFFVIGRDAEQFPTLARRIAADGHEIANHTYTHPDLDRLDAGSVRKELAAAAQALAPFSHDRGITAFMRPPHGRYRVATIAAAQSAGYDVILWNDDPGDWRSVPAAAIETHVFAHATAPEILLLHSGKLSTIEMLPSLVARFSAMHYRFVTVGELLRDVSPDRIIHPEHIEASAFNG